MKKIIIIAHIPSPNTLALAQAVKNGAKNYDTQTVQVSFQSPLTATASDILNADGVIFGTTENLGYMSGALKDFFDRNYYDLIDKTDAMPYALYVRAGLDGTGTLRAIDSIVTKGLKWKPICPPLLCKGEWSQEFIASADELGQTMAAGLDTGIF